MCRWQRSAFLTILLLYGPYVFAMGNGTPGMPCGPSGCKSNTPGTVAAKAENATELITPFMSVCNNDDGLASLKGRPSVWNLQRCIPTEDRGRRGIDFLEILISNAKAYAEANINQTETWRKCLMGEKSNECNGIRADVETFIPNCATVARHHLARGYNKTFWNTRVGYWSPNWELDEMESLKPVPWAPLTEAEKRASLARTQQYFAEASRIADIEKNRPGGPQRSVNEVRFGVLEQLRTSHPAIENPVQQELDGKWERHTTACGEVSLIEKATGKTVVESGDYQAYVQILSRWPILNYIENPKPSRNEIYKAVTKLNENAKAELKELERLHQLTQQSLKSDTIPSDLLKSLSYAGLAEAILRDNPAYCGIVTSLNEVRASRDLSMDVAIASPFLVIMGAGLVVTTPGWIVGAGVVAGVGTAGYYIGQANADLEYANQRALKMIEWDPSVATLEERQALLATYRSTAFTAPLALLGLGGTVKAGRGFVQRIIKLPNGRSAPFPTRGRYPDTH